MALPSKLKNFNLFVDGNSYIGQVTEVVLPKLTKKMEEFRGAGMEAPVDIDFGLEKLSVDWTVGGWFKDVFVQFGTSTHNGTGLRFAGAIQSDDTDEYIPVEVVMRGRHSEIDSGSAKSGEDTEIKITTSLSYYKLTINGEDVIEIDVINLVKKFSGKDLNTGLRAALGV